MLKKDILSHKWANDEGALVGMCEKNEELWLSIVAHWKFAMAYTQ
jgi:hypothetical protein